MNNIGSVKEDLTKEKRISVTPESIKKFLELGFSINLEKQYGEHLGITDNDYKKSGANINFTKEEVLQKSDIILKINCPSADQVNLIKNKSMFSVGQLPA